MGLLIHKGSSDSKTQGYIRTAESITSVAVIVLDNSHLVNLTMRNEEGEEVAAANAISEDHAVET